MVQHKFQNGCSNSISQSFSTSLIHVECAAIHCPLFPYGFSSHRSVKCRPDYLTYRQKYASILCLQPPSTFSSLSSWKIISENNFLFHSPWLSCSSRHLGVKKQMSSQVIILECCCYTIRGGAGGEKGEGRKPTIL